MPRPKNRRTMLSGRRLSDLAQTYTEEAVESIVRIARGEMKAPDAYPYMHVTQNRSNGKARKPKNTKRMDPVELKIEKIVQKELARLYFIPWNVRLQAWMEILKRAHGKPFQSAMVYDENDVKITFKDADELRDKLIAQGIPFSMFEPSKLRLIDADAVRREAEEDSQQYLREQSEP